MKLKQSRSFLAFDNELMTYPKMRDMLKKGIDVKNVG